MAILIGMQNVDLMSYTVYCSTDIAF